MSKIENRFVSFALSMILFLSMFPITVTASEIVDSGKCGENVTWTLDSNGVLTISGKGAMENYYPSGSPFGGNPTAPDETVKKVEVSSGVTGIGRNAFFFCSKLTSIVISESVEKIGEFAFGGCYGISSITVSPENSVYSSSGNCLIDKKNKMLILGCSKSIIPKDGTVIGIKEYAFAGNSQLTSITIPNCVSSIGEGAFSGCTGLLSINIGRGVTSIGENVIENCSQLTSIVVDPENTVYLSKGNCLINKKQKRLMAGCNTSVIPSDGSVTSIDSYAFANCSGLKKIVIPDSITNIMDNAFFGCSGLKSISIGEGIKELKQGVFQDCIELIAIHWPSCLIIIGSSAFSGCSALEVVEIPDSVETIEDGAFFGCANLNELTFGKSVLNIGYHAFYKCNRLMSISVSPDNLEFHSSGNCLIQTKTKALVLGCRTSKIPSDGSVTTIDDFAFEDCTELTSVDIPDSVVSIGDSAFYGCSGLIIVKIGNGVKRIRDGAFGKCKSLFSIIIPTSVTEIGESAFCDCNELTNIYFRGNKAQWSAIHIQDDNEPLLNKKIIFKSNGPLTFAIDSAKAKEQGGSVFAAPDMKAGELLKLAGEGAKLMGADGSALKADDLVGTGTVLIKADGTKETVVVKGDYNGDGKITTADARMALRTAIGLEKPNAAQKKASLVTGGKDVGTSDARMILRAAIGLDTLALV